MSILMSPSWSFDSIPNFDQQVNAGIEVFQGLDQDDNGSYNSSTESSVTTEGDEVSSGELDISPAEDEDWDITMGNFETHTASELAGYARLQVFYSGNMALRKRKTVELKDGDFLKIGEILQLDNDEIFLQGRRFCRTEKLGGIVASRPNEVCWIESIYLDESFVEEMIPISYVVRIRRLRMTNKTYETFNVSHTQTWPPTTRLYRDEGVLICRIKYEVTYNSHAQKKKDNSVSFVDKCIRTLSSAEVDADCWEDPADLRGAWRGFSRGALRRSVSSETLLGDELERSRGLISQKPYTFGDCFCGGGGASSGAQMAGLRVKFGFDYDHNAIRTYQLNFAGAHCENTKVHYFLNDDAYPPEEYRVDIAHMSPPCPAFSPLQVRKPANNDEQEAPITATGSLVKKLRPRIVTLEETFGILHRQHKEWFLCVVNNLVGLDFSVRWQVVNLMDFGVPQKRRRLIVIASSPGEDLPEFPAPTHADAPTTIASAIANIPPGAPNHKFKELVYPQHPYDAHGPLRSLIDTSGGLKNYHPSGKRAFTEREFAHLATFPSYHKFLGGKKTILKQIGNAVPPLPFKTFYEHIIKSLRKTDEAELQ